MIINHRYKFIFLKTRKTAGTSIEIALSQFCGPGDVITPIAKEDELIRQQRSLPGPQNCLVPLKYYRRLDWAKAGLLAGRPRFCNHSTADFVRKRVSEDVWSGYFKFSFERNPFDKAISRYYWSAKEPRPSIADYLSSVRSDLLTNWDVYTINDAIAVDYLGRYENLDDDLQVIKERLGLPGEWGLPRAKGQYRKNREHYSSVLDAVSRERIETVCAKEIKALGYHWQTA